MSAKKSILFVAAVVVVLGLAAQAQAWDPGSVSSLQSWINPADSSKVTVTGGYVSNVVDSENGLNFTPYNGNGVTYDTGAFGSVAGLVFPGNGPNLSHNPASDMLHLATSNTQWAMFAVININSNAPTGNDYTIQDAFYSGGGAQNIFQVGRDKRLKLYPGNTNWIQSPTNAVSLGVPHIVEYEYSGGATPTLQLYVDGVAQTLTGTVPNLSMNAGQVLYVGAQNGADNRFPGKLGDLLNFNGVLSSTDRNNVGAYLQDKYGISGSYVGTIPEPSTLALLAAGLAGLLAYAWRKRR
jgi:hypothetical protein